MGGHLVSLEAHYRTAHPERVPEVGVPVRGLAFRRVGRDSVHVNIDRKGVRCRRPGQLLPGDSGLFLKFAQRAIDQAGVIWVEVAAGQQPLAQDLVADHQHPAAIVDHGGPAGHMPR